VAAENGVGPGPTSPASNAVIPAVPVAPAAPARPSVAAGNASVSVSWSAPNDNGSPIISYSVIATGGPGGPVILRTGTPATTATVGSLTNGTSYTFTVSAENAVGLGPASPASSAVIPLTVPGAPTAVAAIAGDGSALVSWSPPTDAGGSPVTSYTLTARPLLGSAAPPPITVDASVTAITVAGLTNGSGYTFTVTATNSSGKGLPSTPSNIVTPAPDIPLKVASTRSGYWMVEANGHVYPFGDARVFGNPSDPRGQLGTALAVDLEPTPSGSGYWVVDDTGRVFAYGDAKVLPNVLGLLADERVTSLSATPSGGGYWVFTSRGRVLARGDATFFGDMSAVALNGPVSDSIATPSGRGYYMVASDGGIFAFGDAVFYGSMGGRRLNAPVQSLVPDADGVGYWLVAADGGVFSFDAPFRDSMGGTPLNRPITGMVRFGNGYVMVGTDGGIFDFSDRPFLGSLGDNPPVHPIVAVAVFPG
jgi:hypothetical protein